MTNSFKKTSQEFAIIAVSASIINILIYFIAKAVGIFDKVLIQGQEIPAIAFVISTLIGTVFGYILFVLLVKVFKVKSPTVVRSIGYVLLALSLISPFTTAGVTFAAALVLNLCHLVVGAPIIERVAKYLS
jgi:tetrahydromethanopterin S-methyltransferase subunit C